MVKSYILTIVILMGIIGCKVNTKENVAAPAGVIRKIDKIRITNLNGQTIDLKQYQGKSIFINFWATWCKPCIQEMPSIKAAQSILKNEAVIFLMASNESAVEIEQFKINNVYNFDYVRIENSEEMNVQTLPVTFIFNRNGKLVFSEAGSRNWDEKSNIDLILKIIHQND